MRSFTGRMKAQFMVTVEPGTQPGPESTVITVPDGPDEGVTVMAAGIGMMAVVFAADTGARTGKEPETDSPGTNRTPVKGEEPPAATTDGMIEPAGMTLTGPDPTMPYVCPTPYSVWVPPVTGEGNTNDVEGNFPSE